MSKLPGRRLRQSQAVNAAAAALRRAMAEEWAWGAVARLIREACERIARGVMP